VAYLNGEERITSKEQLLQLFLSEYEEDVIKNTEAEQFFFRNGINITEAKHRAFDFRAYFIVDRTSSSSTFPSYLSFIEKRWREQYGLPKLCSYFAGR
jgi:hypothetical protein